MNKGKTIDIYVDVDGLYQWERVNEGDIKIHELGKLSEEAERVEPKKYYLKHKYLIEADIEDVNLEVCSKEWFFDSESNLCYVQKRFTEEEIKELENDGWVLENYRKIEVEDE